MKKPFKVSLCIIGEESCGKTCLVKTLCEGRFDPVYNPTVGIDYGMRHETVEGRHVQLNIFDLSGSEAFAAILDDYLPTAQIVMLCYACGKFDASAAHEYEKRLQRLSAKPVVKALVACKKDLARGDRDHVSKFCSESGFAPFALSAKDPAAVRLLFRQALELFARNAPQPPKG